MSYASVILADNPIRYYRLDESSGTTAHDAGSQAQDGTLSGGITLSQTGLLISDSDPAMRFNGSSGKITASTTGLPTGAHAWSIELWAQYPTLTGNYQGLIGMGHDVNGANSIVEIYYSPSLHKLGFGADSGNDLFFASTVVAGTTYYLVMTYDGTTLTLYENGTAVNSQTITMALNYTSGIFAIGVDQQGLYSSAVEDEVAIYNYALTPSQVTNHYLTGSTIPPPTTPTPVTFTRAKATATLARAKAIATFSRAKGIVTFPRA